MKKTNGISLKYLSKLTNFLEENEWLKVWTTQNEPVINDFNLKEGKNVSGYLSAPAVTIKYKPPGIWFSKGSWLFHELCCNLDHRIIYTTIDYSNIYKITGKNPYTDPIENTVYKKKIKSFDHDYGHIRYKNNGVHKDEVFSWCSLQHNKDLCESTKNIETGVKTCKWNKKTKRCDFKTSCNKNNKDCIYDYYRFAEYDWDKIIDKYDGFCIYPYMTDEFMTKIQKHYTFSLWDVESLILFNTKPIIKYHDLGSISEIINAVNPISQNKENKMLNCIDYSKLINNIIKKIKIIRKNTF
jgi:hypothetical protein